MKKQAAHRPKFQYSERKTSFERNAMHSSQTSVSIKSTTLSKDKRNRYGKTLLLRCALQARRSPMIPPFQRKPAPQMALPFAYR